MGLALRECLYTRSIPCNEIWDSHRVIRELLELARGRNVPRFDVIRRLQKMWERLLQARRSGAQSLSQFFRNRGTCININILFQLVTCSQIRRSEPIFHAVLSVAKCISLHWNNLYFSQDTCSQMSYICIVSACSRKLSDNSLNFHHNPSSLRICNILSHVKKLFLLKYTL